MIATPPSVVLGAGDGERLELLRGRLDTSAVIELILPEVRAKAWINIYLTSPFSYEPCAKACTIDAEVCKGPPTASKHFEGPL